MLLFGYLLAICTLNVMCKPHNNNNKHHHHHKNDPQQQQQDLNSIQTPIVPDKTLTCLYENRTYPAGSKFQPNPCTHCHCPHHGGRARCTVEDCRYIPNCVEWKKQDTCCGTCLKVGCKHSDGNIYNPGSRISVSACETCFCPPDGGRTFCKPTICPPVNCVDPVTLQGECCKTCPNGDNCWYKGRIIPSGAVVKDGCMRCKCPDYSNPFWIDHTKIQATCSFKRC